MSGRKHSPETKAKISAKQRASWASGKHKPSGWAAYGKTIPFCHPERKHFAFAMCHPCYDKRRPTRPTGYKAWDAVRALKDNPCVDCGGRFIPEAMHFDHVPGRGEKVTNVSHLMGHASLQTILDEIGKCELVCANCHAVRTVSRRGLAPGVE